MLLRSHKPLVSIGVPTYNRPQELLETIRQIKDQTYQKLQVIICDNGGSVTADIIASIDGDVRFEVYENSKDIGLLRNTEKVFQLARGEYFCWFSDDDWHAPEFIETLLEVLLNNALNKWVFSNFLERTRNGPVRAPFRNELSKSLSYMASDCRVYRLLRFFLSDHAKGKCNAFYGLFSVDILRDFNFERMSNNYTDYALDKYIVFEALKVSKAAIVHDPLISLTCENQKYYEIKRSFSLVGKLKRFLSDQLSSAVKLALSAEYILLSCVFMVLTPVKIIADLMGRLFAKIKEAKFKKSKNWQNYINIFKNGVSVKKSLNLESVSLVCVATKNVERGVLALKYSQRDIRFGQTLLFSHYKPQINHDLCHIKIKPFSSVEEWGEFIIYDLHKYIKTEYILLIHDDGFVVNANSWDPKFLDYDYIGAPWPIPKDDFSYRTDSGELVRIGNSVSIRSKRILELPSLLNLPWVPFHGYKHEDGFLTVQYRDILVAKGINYAPVQLGESFGREYVNTPNPPFTFHKWLGNNKVFPNFSNIE